MDSTEYRQIVGHFASGVTVVTSNAGGRLHGMTASAFASLSLDPLLVLVCIDRAATCFRQVETAGAFGINILSAEQSQVSNTFAQRLEPVNAETKGRRGVLHGSDFEFDEHGVPLLERCLARFSCALHDVLDGGDHGIFVGRVRGGGVVEPASSPLVYYTGRYSALQT